MKKLLVLAVLLGVSFTTLTFAQEETTTTTGEGSSGTVITTTGNTTTGSTVTGHKAKRGEKKAKLEQKKTELKAKQLQKKEQITQKKAVKVSARAERLRGIIAKINDGFLKSLLTQIDHLFAKAQTEESKVMIGDIKLLIQDKLGLLSGATVEDPTGTGSTVTIPTDDDDEDEDEVEDEDEDEDNED